MMAFPGVGLIREREKLMAVRGGFVITIVLIVLRIAQDAAASLQLLQQRLRRAAVLSVNRRDAPSDRHRSASPHDMQFVAVLKMSLARAAPLGIGIFADEADRQRLGIDHFHRIGLR